MVLVPRQIKMTGMTGNVPYYGGRFTPAQAYAAAHPTPSEAPSPPPEQSRAERAAALQRLLDDGVITEAEHDDLRARLDR